jgi:Zn finger protein HypA/HybF involved in hydrogenase expression
VFILQVKERKKRSPIWKIERELLEKIINKSETFREVLEYFNLANHGGNYSTLKKRIETENIDISHLEISREKAQQQHLEKLHKGNAKELKDILVENSSYGNNTFLKEKLIKSQLLEEKCHECNVRSIWNGKKLVLQLEHKNGNNRDNRLQNLILLCPNCHSQTDTFTGKKRKKHLNCDSCQISITKHSESGLCRSCAANVNNYQNRKVKDRPSKQELLKLILEKPFTQIANEYMVSDNAIRKWCKTYDLPYRKKEIESLKIKNSKDT